MNRNRIVPALDAELAALRGAALIELNQLAEDTGFDLAPPNPAGLSDMALGLGNQLYARPLLAHRGSWRAARPGDAGLRRADRRRPWPTRALLR